MCFAKYKKSHVSFQYIHVYDFFMCNQMIKLIKTKANFSTNYQTFKSQTTFINRRHKINTP